MNAPQRRPSIAVTPDLSEGSDPPRFELKASYAEAVMEAGGLPFVLPYAREPSVIDSFLERVSGVVLTGGAFDIPPELYGQAPREGLGKLKPERTEFELAVLRAALERGLPVLGICGGMQLMNVARGGTLFQDIGREVPGAYRHQQTHDRSQPLHLVDVAQGTHLAEAVGAGALMVNSTHHQAVAVPGRGVLVSARAPDGVIEALEFDDHPFAVGVQWHPEMMSRTVPVQLRIYRSFVGRARDGVRA